jgi:hypothetical protein
VTADVDPTVANDAQEATREQDQTNQPVKAPAPAGHIRDAPVPARFSQSIAPTQNVHNMQQAGLPMTTAIDALQQLLGKHVLDKISTSL